MHYPLFVILYMFIIYFDTIDLTSNIILQPLMENDNQFSNISLIRFLIFQTTLYFISLKSEYSNRTTIYEKSRKSSDKNDLFIFFKPISIYFVLFNCSYFKNIASSQYSAKLSNSYTGLH